MDRDNHYETAFEAYLRAARLCFVAVDEAKRSTLEEEPIKSLDFVVTASPQNQLLVDVKGRKFPSGKPEKPRLVWENWCTREDVDGLARWQRQFGTGSHGLLVFAYLLAPEVDVPLGTPDLWIWKGNRYLFRAISVGEYARTMRVRSPKWDTVHLRAADFRSSIRPFAAYC